MITALDAKLIAYRKRDYYNIVENKISEAANNGDLMCSIQLNEIPNGTMGIFYEISNLLFELGYLTAIDQNKLYIYWHLKHAIDNPVYINYFDESDGEEK